jgi:hypothetical protein
LVAFVISNKDKSFELTLAKTCKTLYGRYEQHDKEKTAVVLYDPKSLYLDYAENIKALQLFGWLRLKFASIRNSQNSNCPVKMLCLNQDFDVPKELDCMCVNSLTILSSLERDFTSTISFVEKFSNLKSLSFISATFNNDVIVSIVPKLSFLGFISLDHCKMASSHLKIFENFC